VIAVLLAIAPWLHAFTLPFGLQPALNARSGASTRWREHGLNRRRTVVAVDFLSPIDETLNFPHKDISATQEHLRVHRWQQADPTQLEAISADAQAVLLLAGAGTGKTRVLAARLAHILRTGQHRGRGPGQADNRVVVLSFSSSAAHQICMRAAAIPGSDAALDSAVVWHGTFHTLAISLLNKYPYLGTGLSRFSVADPVEQQMALTSALQEVGRAGEDATMATAVLRRISVWKESGMDEHTAGEWLYRRASGGIGGMGSEVDRIALAVYPYYQRALRRSGKLDFGDLLVCAVRLLQTKPEILRTVHKEIGHVLVDEFQDASPVQYELLRLLVTGVFATSPSPSGSSSSGSAYSVNGVDQPASHGQDLPPLYVEAAAASVMAYGGVGDVWNGEELADGLEGFQARGTGGVAQKGSARLICAGDDDQSIYGWRGVDAMQNIRRFTTDFEGSRVLHLENTYRLPRPILGVSARLIHRNSGRIPKPQPQLGQGGPGSLSAQPSQVVVQGVFDGKDEAKFVAQSIEDIISDWVEGSPPPFHPPASSGSTPSTAATTNPPEVAILARSSWQFKDFEEQLIQRQIPYTLEGGLSFFSRPELRFPLDLLRCLTNPDDDLAFVTVASHSSLVGIRDITTTRLRELAVEHAVSMNEAARLAVSEHLIKGRVGEALDALVRNLDRWREMVSHFCSGETGANMLKQIFHESGYYSYLESRRRRTVKRGSGYDKSVASVNDLAEAASTFSGLEQFLLHVTLQAEGSAGEPADRAAAANGVNGAGHERQSSDVRVRLMSMHKAKGREFSHVFVPGWEEGVFPALSPDNSLDEERRLAYMSMTRASSQLVLTHASRRQLRGRWTVAERSRFLSELASEYVALTDGGNKRASMGNRATPTSAPPHATVPPSSASSDAESSDTAPRRKPRSRRSPLPGVVVSSTTGISFAPNKSAQSRPPVRQVEAPTSSEVHPPTPIASSPPSLVMAAMEGFLPSLLTMKVPELKAELRRIGLAVSGRKAELQQRLAEHFSTIAPGPVAEAMNSSRKLPAGQRTTHPRSVLEKLTVIVLKAMLREHGLRVSGRKAELIQRLTAPTTLQQRPEQASGKASSQKQTSRRCQPAGRKGHKGDTGDGPLMQRTVIQLKELLRERGLKVSGRKAELVKRLEDAGFLPKDKGGARRL